MEMWGEVEKEKKLIVSKLFPFYSRQREIFFKQFKQFKQWEKL